MEHASTSLRPRARARVFAGRLYGGANLSARDIAGPLSAVKKPLRCVLFCAVDSASRVALAGSRSRIHGAVTERREAILEAQTGRASAG